MATPSMLASVLKETARRFYSRQRITEAVDAGCQARRLANT